MAGISEQNSRSQKSTTKFTKKFYEFGNFLFQVLSDIHGEEKAEEELDQIKEEILKEPKIGVWPALKRAMKSGTTRRPLILGCLLQLFQQAVGCNTVMYYSAKIIAMAGIDDNETAIWISAGVASVNFLCTFIGLYLVEKIGKEIMKEIIRLK